MLRFPGKLSAQQFLDSHWQKQPLFVPAGLNGLQPSISRNELAWLATHEDVESRIVFTESGPTGRCYRVETGPFDSEFLSNLPRKNWTLLVHDVDKHVPALRRLIRNVPFIPDWRVDDLMVSFAAPGGGVGPHRDRYDVFLCQGIGRRNWRYSSENIPSDPAASGDIALLREFEGEHEHGVVAGDVLYLPPGVAHWGTATRACMTYSIGMRAPRISELLGSAANIARNNDVYYQDPNLSVDEAIPGLISKTTLQRICDLGRLSPTPALADALGCSITRTKNWLIPEMASPHESRQFLSTPRRFSLHGMARIAFDNRRVYLNGHSVAISGVLLRAVQRLCHRRSISRDDVATHVTTQAGRDWLAWMLTTGAFVLPE